MEKIGPFIPTKLEELKYQHRIAVDKMNAAIDRVNDLKCQIWAIEAEQMKNEV